MNLLTLEELRSGLWRYCPIPKTPYTTATQAQKDLADEYINRACRKLLQRLASRFTLRRVNLPVINGYITLPRELDSIEGIQMIDGNGCGICHPLPIYSRFHEWAHPVGSCPCSSFVSVLADNAQVFTEPSPGDEGFKLQVEATESGTITFKGGYNADWEQYFDEVSAGFINGTVTTARIWNSLPQIQKPVTTGSITLNAVDVATSDVTALAIYAPGDTIPAFKRYRVPEWNGAPLARVFGKLAFVKAVADNDIPYPNDENALQYALQAMAYDDAADIERGEALWSRAEAVLDKDRQEQDVAEIPVFRVADDFGCATIANVI